jgi:hypothetical protein
MSVLTRATWLNIPEDAILQPNYYIIQIHSLKITTENVHCQLGSAPWCAFNLAKNCSIINMFCGIKNSMQWLILFNQCSYTKTKAKKDVL